MDDLTSEFLVETNESLEELDLDLVSLEKNPQDTEIIHNIFRVMHTIKGTCGFLGLPRLERLAHAAENIMDELRDGAFAVTPGVISLVLEAIDSIKNIIAYLEENEVEPEGEDAELIDKLNECAKTGIAPGRAQEVAPAQEVEPTQEEVAAAPKTPDLDEEIDFEPIPAPDASFGDDVQDEAPTDDADKAGWSTPDLDEDIDFTPVPAPDIALPAQQPEAREEHSEQAQQAVSRGLSLSQEVQETTAKDEAGTKKATSSAQHSIRVSLDVLEDLMQMVGELVLTRNQLMQLARNQEASEKSSSSQGRHGTGPAENSFSVPLQRLNHITSELQEGVMKTRMQPIGSAWAKFPRLIRDLSLELNKKIELKMNGADTDLDRQMLEAIKDPLTHMVRNSVDHGLEPVAERVASGKTETGTVTLSAYHEGGHIVIKIADDGRGLNIDRIKEKAIENGLATAEEMENMNDKQISQFIFKAGFSTAEQITSVSGRGVGMDVVVNNIEKIGGTVDVSSRRGKGSEFNIKLPLTLAIMPVLVVESGGDKFAIPQIRVSEIVRSENMGGKQKEGSFDIETINGSPVLRLRGRLLPLVSLADTLGLVSEYHDSNGGIEPFIVVCEVGGQSVGILVDKVFHTEEIVVKPVAPIVSNLEVYSGCTILGDGSVIMILDPNGIIRRSGMNNLHEDIEGDNDEQQQSFREDEKVSFLMFRASEKTPYVVPLDLVSRLEEIDMSNVEWSGELPVVQYRGQLMHLVSIHGDIPREGVKEVIVFTDDRRVVGLVTYEVMDIVHDRMDIKSDPGKPGILGSLVIDEITTDLVDVSYYFGQIFENWFENKGGTLTRVGEQENGKRKHILLVDDSPFFRKFMKPVLVVSNFTVTTAEDGAEAFDILAQKAAEIDLVVTDIDMPNMNGLELVKHCKADSNTAHIPFVGLSSHTEDELGGDPASHGFDGYVSKSDRDRLIEVISDILSEVDVKEAA